MASFFKMEDLMTNYVTSNILSYLDFKSMVVARMFSKTWYDFIENDGGLWNNLMKKRFEDIQKKIMRHRDWLVASHITGEDLLKKLKKWQCCRYNFSTTPQFELPLLTSRKCSLF